MLSLTVALRHVYSHAGAHFRVMYAAVRAPQPCTRGTEETKETHIYRSMRHYKYRITSNTILIRAFQTSRGLSGLMPPKPVTTLFPFLEIEHVAITGAQLTP